MFNRLNEILSAQSQLCRVGVGIVPHEVVEGCQQGISYSGSSQFAGSTLHASATLGLHPPTWHSLSRPYLQRVVHLLQYVLPVLTVGTILLKPPRNTSPLGPTFNAMHLILNEIVRRCALPPDSEDCTQTAAQKTGTIS